MSLLKRLAKLLPSTTTDLPRPAGAGQKVVTLQGQRLALLSGSAKGAQRLWSEVGPEVVGTIIALHADYTSASPDTRPLTPAAAWKSMRDGSIRVGKGRSMQLSARFAWQDRADGHRVTIYVEKGAVVGHSVDG